MAMENYDFSGWATRSNVRCSDGRTILNDAFKDCDGKQVPLVWNHNHSGPESVLGHAVLENRGDGVYAYVSCNNTENAKAALEQVKHGDITQMSIWANDLEQQGSKVVHGIIREVSLVLAGSNPGAFIDSIIAHGEDEDDAAIIYSGMPLELFHAADDDAKEESSDEDKKEQDDETIQDVVNSMNEKQQDVLAYLVGAAVQGAFSDKDEDKTEDEVKQSDNTDSIEGGNTDMKHNVFEGSEGAPKQNTLSHSQMETIFEDAKVMGSLKKSVLSHADEYGITDIDYLFPDAKTLTNQPEFISRPMGWVTSVMNATHHTPFSRIKTIFADITADEARALGYIKGNRKKDEVFTLLKRTTDPQTVYKIQKLDRDDVLDITDFDVLPWIKSEMRTMLDEEIARAILIGDGRMADSADKISENHIRPILTDDDLYTIKYEVTPDDGEELAAAIIDGAVRARIDYRGSGSPTMFVSEEYLTEMMLLKDYNKRRIYKDEKELATAMMVNAIVPVPLMADLQRGDHDVYAIIVNLTDYNVGADKGGAVSMFDDFDINYNQMTYLLETRCSGALVKPYSAIVLESGDTDEKN